ncbi:MAG: single-stranded-DNA-specific exonuclease RecJ [Gammaproteobacteria bacterium]|nr:single-stranded-DNA-specific exonuclease RecJ [Gammaproteobacteria bacterium]
MNQIIKQRPIISDHLSFDDKLHPVLKRVFQRRPLQHSNDLDCGLKQLLSFHALKGMDQAVALLHHAMQTEQRIVVVGDFDADGATSTAVAIKGLRMLGARRVSFHVPNRFKYGYGLTPGIVEEVHQLGADLIITVDNGIASFDGIATAKTLGMQVLVTDHHLAADQLPAADAIVNPNQPGDLFESKNLAGVGVIFYVLLALRAHLRSIGWFEQRTLAEPNLATLLDLVALGTVADVVALDHNNRILVSQGLQRIRQGMACPGIQALIEVSKRPLTKLVANDLGFGLGPRLNAAGRLEDMSIGINCLLADNLGQARQLAVQLDNLNQERKVIEQEMKSQALDDLRRLNLGSVDRLPLGVCIYQPEWHQGVIGILASRIKDHLHRPVIALAEEDEQHLKGSARSVAGVHIRDVLDAISKRHPHLLNKFGGHAMAAGLSLAKAHLPAFQQAFADEVAHYLSREQLQGVVYSDGELQPDEFNLETAISLRQSGPWGQAFPEPVFDGHFEVLQVRVMSDKHLKLTLRHPRLPQPVEAVGFNQLEPGESPAVQNGDRVHLAYKLDINEFRGDTRLQLMMECLLPQNVGVAPETLE